MATQKDRYVSPVSPEAPPVPPPPLPSSSSTEDDGVLYSLQPQFAASSISLSFSFSPDCPGMNGDAGEGKSGGREKRRKKERKRETWQRTPDDGFGGTREIEGERNDRWLPW